MEVIDPEPGEHDREAILAALDEQPPTRGGWDAAALAEAVSGEAPTPLHGHDVRPLW